jgi:hypothetical protein
MLRKLWLAGFVCAYAAAQDPGWVSAHKAPEGTNEALRARVSAFYQAFVEGKFRKADEYVAEDSKETFFAMEKKPYKAFEVMDLYYTPDFTTAKVITKVTTELHTPRINNMQMQPVVQTFWKKENGTWSWFQPTGTRTMDTPFGKMTFGPPTNSGPTILGQKRVSVEEVLQKITIDTETVRISPSRGGTQTTTITSNLGGNVTLVIEPFSPVPGLAISADRNKIAAGEKATVTFGYKPGGQTPPYLEVNLFIPETGQRFPVRVNFTEPSQRVR